MSLLSAYQLLTHALLHEGVLHIAGNFLFLLVLGTRGGGGFRGLGFGSTADQVVRHAICPVVVVPVTGEDDPDDLDSQLRSH